MASPFEPGSTGGASLREAKRAMRDRVLRERDALPPDVREQAGRVIVATLAARADFRAAATVLLPLSFRGEYDTRPLFDAALASGKVVSAPRVNTDRRMLEAYVVTDPARDVAPGFRGIPEPLPHCAGVTLDAIDWVLVPGVAFDLHGHRIGYGGGYYDRLLPLLRNDAQCVAGAFELQLVEQVPSAPHDLAVDAIVTERRTVEVRPGSL